MPVLNVKLTAMHPRVSGEAWAWDQHHPAAGPPVQPRNQEDWPRQSRTPKGSERYIGSPHGWSCRSSTIDHPSTGRGGRTSTAWQYTVAQKRSRGHGTLVANRWQKRRGCGMWRLLSKGPPWGESGTSRVFVKLWKGYLQTKDLHWGGLESEKAKVHTLPSTVQARDRRWPRRSKSIQTLSNDLPCIPHSREWPSGTQDRQRQYIEKSGIDI